MPNRFLAVKQELREIGEKSRIADGNAVGGDQLPELANDVVQIRNGSEFPGKSDEFVLQAVEFGQLDFFACVKDAKSRMGRTTEHAASAAVSEGEGTEILRVRRNTGTRGSYVIHRRSKMGTDV